MSSKEWRLASAVFIGVILHALFYWKFQPYNLREHSHEIVPWYFLPLLTFLTGLFLTLTYDGQRRWIPVALFAGCGAANACLIVVDCSSDPTNHNLWPFEFVVIAAATAPAYLGVGISVLLDRRRGSD